jgi:3-hydroxyisobutyrate dehydrogenase-like beta-hydroxyacid dehydrogenase
MAQDSPGPVTVLGLGAMGRALAEVVASAGHPTTVWNRSASRASGLAERGVRVAATVEEAVEASEVVVACLLDHASVHQVLDPVASRLAGRALVNLTTTAPAQARELAEWAAAHQISYLDGAIMAVPAMIGKPGSALLYSGAPEVFERHRPLLDRWGECSFFGADAGLASLWDLAMLSGMYMMLAGFMHGAAMVGSEGVAAREFASRAAPFLAAMTDTIAATAEAIDAGDYGGEGAQRLEFTALAQRHILQASVDQGVSTEVFMPVYELVRRRIDAGRGGDGSDSVYEELRRRAS